MITRDHILIRDDIEEQDASKKPKNWTPVEDQNLCEAYYRVSTDPVKGVDRQSDDFFNEVYALFVHRSRQNGATTERPFASFKTRWRKIRAATQRWTSICVQVKPKSGENERDLEERRQKMYMQEQIGSKSGATRHPKRFTFHRAFEAIQLFSNHNVAGTLALSASQVDESALDDYGGRGRNFTKMQLMSSPATPMETPERLKLPKKKMKVQVKEEVKKEADAAEAFKETMTLEQCAVKIKSLQDSMESNVRMLAMQGLPDKLKTKISAKVEELFQEIEILQNQDLNVKKEKKEDDVVQGLKFKEEEDEDEQDYLGFGSDEVQEKKMLKIHKMKMSLAQRKREKNWTNSTRKRGNNRIKKRRKRRKTENWKS